MSDDLMNSEIYKRLRDAPPASYVTAEVFITNREFENMSRAEFRNMCDHQFTGAIAHLSYKLVSGGAMAGRWRIEEKELRNNGILYEVYMEADS